MRPYNLIGIVAIFTVMLVARPTTVRAQAPADGPSAEPVAPPIRYSLGQQQPASQIRSTRPLKRPVGHPAAPQRPEYQLAARPEKPKPETGTDALRLAGPDEHPLEPILDWAKAGRPEVAAIKDYSAIMVKRERVDGELSDEQYMFVKVRHEPFSVYTYFMAPADLKGQEAIFVEGKNDNEIQAHGTGLQKTMFGTVSLAPRGMIAMRGQRYPITEIGMLNLVDRLIEVAEKDLDYGESEVKIFRNATLNKRSCTCIQVIHPVPRSNFLFHIARIFIDDEWNLPVRYEAYDWPSKPGGPPQLIEQYTYVDVKMNNGFTDADFDVRNPNYDYQ